MPSFSKHQEMLSHTNTGNNFIYDREYLNLKAKARVTKSKSIKQQPSQEQLTAYI